MNAVFCYVRFKTSTRYSHPIQPDQKNKQESEFPYNSNMISRKSQFPLVSLIIHRWKAHRATHKLGASGVSVPSRQLKEP